MSTNNELKHRALQALGSLFVRAPELMLKPHAAAAMKAAFSSEFADVRLQMINNMAEFLTVEEEKINSAAKQTGMQLLFRKLMNSLALRVT